MGNIQQVNGVKVVDWRPAITGVKQAVHKAEQLVLEDGTTTYGCTFDGCDYTAPTFQAITSGHWQTHEPRPPKRWMEIANMPIGEVMDLVTTYDKELKRVTAERDEARQRSIGYRNELRATEAKLERREKRIGSSEEELQNRIAALLDQVAEAIRAQQAAELRADTLQDEINEIRSSLATLGFLVNRG